MGGRGEGRITVAEVTILKLLISCSRGGNRPDGDRSEVGQTGIEHFPARVISECSDVQGSFIQNIAVPQDGFIFRLI